MYWEPTDWFNEKPHEMTIGAEAELVVFDSRNNCALRDENRLMRAVNRLPENIYRDHYPFQVEIRSDPFDNPKDIMNQMLDLYKQTDEEFQKDGLYIVPISWVGLKGENCWCGMHVHVRYKDAAENKMFFEKAWGAYPFILALADYTKNAEDDMLTGSLRLRDSHHIRIPNVDREMLNYGTGNARYSDITANRLTGDGEEARKRLKKVTTLETRIFDTPSLFSHLQFIIEGTYNIFSHVKNDAPTSKNPREYADRLAMSRALAVTQRYGLNTVLNDANLNVCRDMSKLWGIGLPKTTQFDFRDGIKGLKPVEKKLVMRQFGWMNKNY